MPFFVPMSLPLETVGGQWAQRLSRASPAADFLFPRVQVPRGSNFSDSRASFLPGPASSASVIKVMRYLLTLPPLSLSTEVAQHFSGHSLRHMLPTLARALALPIEDREELGRWAARLDARARDQHMPNLYSAEAVPQRVVAIVRRLLVSAHGRVAAEGGPAALFRLQPLSREAWSFFGPGDLSPLVGAEASSSESDSGDEAS